MLALKRFVAIVLLAGVVASCEIVDEVTPRTFAGLLVAHAAPLKIKIAKSLLASPGKAVPQAGALKLPPPAGVAALDFDFGWVTSGGAIFIQSAKYGVVVFQEPFVMGDAIRWTCVVHPATAKPSLCGSDYENSLLNSR